MASSDEDDNDDAAWTEGGDVDADAGGGGGVSATGDDAGQAPFEIVDHTTVTPWERLVAAIEAHLRGWARDARDDDDDEDDGGAAVVTWDTVPYLLTVHGHRPAPKGPYAATPGGGMPHGLRTHFDDTTTDFLQVGGVHLPFLSLSLSHTHTDTLPCG
jgi:hypothetical protein